jgi:putative acetyltransferase
VTALVVRPERAGDHDAIRLMVTAAFGSTVEADLVERIRASSEYVPETALVAELDGRVVGHVMVSGATLRNDEGERTISMLSPLAVDPVHHGAGIGGALVRTVTAIADERGEPLVVLEGSPRHYARFGFVHSVPHGIELPLPDWAPAEAAQVLLLRSYDPDDSALRGRVVYPAAFDGVE